MDGFRRLFLTTFALVFLALSGCAGVPGAPEGVWIETVFLDHKDSAGNPIKLEAIIYLPVGSGPFDVALHNHGGHARKNSSDVRKGEEVAGPFLKQGVAVVALIRQGRGRSGGTVSSVNCNPTNALRGFEQDYGDTLRGVEFIQNSPLFKGKKVYTYGHSRGGLLSAALAVRTPQVFSGAVGFGTGWLMVSSCSNGQALQNLAFTRLASRNAAPTLFLYAENDSYFHPRSNEESFSVYKNKGGTGVLKTYPPVSNGFGDGHMAIYSLSVWEKDVVEFLGIGKK